MLRVILGELDPVTTMHPVNPRFLSQKLRKGKLKEESMVRSMSVLDYSLPISKAVQGGRPLFASLAPNS